MPLRLHTILLTALVAGSIAGLVFFLAQAGTTRPLIVRAEIAERAQASSMVTHDHAATEHAHAAMADEEWEPAEGIERTAYTFGADALIGIGYAFLLIGAIALSGRAITVRAGLLWGAAGFLVFAAAPSLGLPPEPPGVHGAELLVRQEWWLFASMTSSIGLWLIVLQERTLLRIAGVFLLLLPHLIGTPRGDEITAAAPELLAPFVWASLAANAALWLSLGLAVGALLPRLGSRRVVPERAAA